MELGAYARFGEGMPGLLDPGTLGDVAVYPDDPLGTPPERLAGTPVDLTVVGDVVVHHAGDS